MASIDLSYNVLEQELSVDETYFVSAIGRVLEGREKGLKCELV